jgi:hypothetical protein
MEMTLGLELHGKVVFADKDVLRTAAFLAPTTGWLGSRSPQ